MRDRTSSVRDKLSRKEAKTAKYRTVRSVCAEYLWKEWSTMTTLVVDYYTSLLLQLVAKQQAFTSFVIRVVSQDSWVGIVTRVWAHRHTETDIV
jgi:hypothetical protein